MWLQAFCIRQPLELGESLLVSRKKKKKLLVSFVELMNLIKRKASVLRKLPVLYIHADEQSYTACTLLDNRCVPQNLADQEPDGYHPLVKTRKIQCVPTHIHGMHIYGGVCISTRPCHQNPFFFFLLLTHMPSRLLGCCDLQTLSALHSRHWKKTLENRGFFFFLALQKG